MKVKDIVAKTSYVVLIAKENEHQAICDNVGLMGDYKEYENATVKSIYPFHTRSGMYKEGIMCIIKDKKK